MGNTSLRRAKRENNDEFYTQYADIEKEIMAYIEYNPDVFRNKTILLPCDDPEWSNFTKFFVKNFDNFGLKKLISTCYSSNPLSSGQLSFFDNSTTPQVNGKLLYLEHSVENVENLNWEYLNGNGDFRSSEIKNFRNEADVIITNPPFSLFREFINWVLEAEKKFIIMCHKNALAYVKMSRLLMSKKIWVGATLNKSNHTYFLVPDNFYNDIKSYKIGKNGEKYIRVNVSWVTNLEHVNYSENSELMTMEENLKYSKYSDLREFGYRKYDNYDILNVPHVSEIPSDYKDLMGVPVTFFNRRDLDKFEFIAILDNCKLNQKAVFKRIIIKHKM